MEKRQNIQIANMGMVVEVATNGPTIYLQGQSIDSAKELIWSYGHIACETRFQITTVLMAAQNCNAKLRQIRSFPERGMLQIALEFDFWDDFLEFKKKMEELSQ